MEAATVFWHDTSFLERERGQKIDRGRSRVFESVENAVRFTMEELNEGDRSTAIIQTDSRSIHLADIEKMHGSNKKAASTGG